MDGCYRPDAFCDGSGACAAEAGAGPGEYRGGERADIWRRGGDKRGSGQNARAADVGKASGWMESFCVSRSEATGSAVDEPGFGREGLRESVQDGAISAGKRIGKGDHRVVAGFRNRRDG